MKCRSDSIPDDPDLLGTCALHLKKLIEIVEGEDDKITHPLFDSLSDREILELIFKANQSEEEFDPNFGYLPKSRVGKAMVKTYFHAW